MEEALIRPLVGAYDLSQRDKAVRMKPRIALRILRHTNQHPYEIEQAVNEMCLFPSVTYLEQLLPQQRHRARIYCLRIQIEPGFMG